MFCIIVTFISTLLFSQSNQNLYSPYIELPTIGEDETMHFGFWIYADMPDYDGDNDDYLDDYYNIAINDISALAWHPSDFNSIDGNNFWCSDNDIEGYLDSWIHYLDTPSIAVGSGGEYFSRVYYAIESPDGAGGEVENSCTDGWDTANIRISIDDGVSWELLNGSISYDFDCGYGWIWNDAEYETGGSLNHLAAGWGGSSNGWVDFSADLSAYAGENIIIRIAFGSDPAYSTNDDSALTGLQIDDIMIEDDTGVLFSDLGDDMSQMVASGEVWIDQFYDYGSVESGRPGSSGWAEYVPGLAFNGNVFMNITEFEEKIIQFRIQSRYDNNHDGGQGGGLFIDDFMIYKLSLGVYFAPWDLTADPGNSEVILSWYDMNAAGTENFIYENGIFSEDNSIYTAEGNGWAGQLFNIIGPSRINSFSVYNVSQIDTTISVAVYGMFGTTIDTEPTYTMEVPLNSSLDWNNFIVSDSSWIMDNYFVIAHEISSSFGVAVDTTQTSGHSYLRMGGSWLGLANSLGYQGEFGIRSNITYEGADVSYNIYRNDSLIVSELLDNIYADLGLTNNATYEYAVSAIYPDGTESVKSDFILATPMSSTVHELYHDDGSFESEFIAGSGNFSAVRFSAGSSGEDIARFKWYQNGSGGAFYIKVFQDDGGLPGDEIYSAIQTSNNTAGWNDKDLSNQGLNVVGDFWIGAKEFSSSNPFGLDTSSDSGNSYQRVGSTGDWTAISGNLGYHVYLDSGEGAGRMISSWNNKERPAETSQHIYSLLWENKKLRRVPSLLNGNNINNLSMQSDILNRVNVVTDTLFILKKYDFEDADNDWTHSAGWHLSTIESYSPNHSFNSPNDSSNGLFSAEYTLPQKYIINRIFPNPFNPIANIQFTISEFTNVRLSISDLNGRIVKTLTDQMMSPGCYTVAWNGEDIHGKPVSSGIYFSILENKDKSVQSKKLVLLK